MGATRSEGGAGEDGTKDATEASSADLRLLQSLDAKIAEVIAAELAAQRPKTNRIARQSLRAAVSAPIDSTQTARPLTAQELEASAPSQWFVIELMHSTRQIEAAQVPNLSIFEEYKLYVVAAPEQGWLLHTLRLGFFSTEIAAAAVLRYLASYFPLATLQRVSIAERERFADKLITAGKEIGVSGKRIAIEIGSAPAASRGAPRHRTTQGQKPT